VKASSDGSTLPRHGQHPADHVGGPGLAAAQQDHRAVRIGTESLLRFPEPRQLIRTGSRCSDEQQREDNRFHIRGYPMMAVLILLYAQTSGRR